MGESGTFGGNRDWAAFVLGSGEKWQLKAPIEALLQIAYTSCLLYMGVELRCIWSEGEC
jgi:hypothetical protein